MGARNASAFGDGLSRVSRVHAQKWTEHADYHSGSTAVKSTVLANSLGKAATGKESGNRGAAEQLTGGRPVLGDRLFTPVAAFFVAFLPRSSQSFTVSYQAFAELTWALIFRRSVVDGL